MVTRAYTDDYAQLIITCNKMRRVFACSTSPKGKGGEAAPLGRLRLWKPSSIDYVVFHPPYSPWKWVDFGRSNEFSIDGNEIFFYLAMFPLETRYIYIWFVGVNCFLSFSIKWIEIEEEQELIVSLVLINFWKRSWVVCCSSLFTEEALIGLEILVSSLHALFLILHRFEEYEWYL